MSLLKNRGASIAILLICFMFLSLFSMGCLNFFGKKDNVTPPPSTDGGVDTGGDTGGDSGSTTEPSGVPFKVVIVTWPGFGPLYLAKEKGFFEGLDVQIEIMDDTAARRSTFSSGKAEAIAETLDSFANGIASGLPGKAVIKTDDSAGGDGLVVKKDINKINDLKGKIVAYPEGLPSHFFLLYLLSLTGLSSADIKSQPMEADQAATAFIAGKVDACVTWEPFLSEAGNSENGKILMTTSDAQGLILDLIIVGDDVIKNRPGDVQKFVNGWFKAIEYWKANPADANNVMSKAFELPLADLEAMLSVIKLADLGENKTYFGTPENPGQFGDVFDTAGMIWEQEGLIEKAVPADQAYDTQFINAVNAAEIAKIDTAPPPTEVPAPTEVAVAEPTAGTVAEPTEVPAPTEAPPPTAKPTVAPTKAPEKPQGQDIAQLEVPPIFFETGSANIDKNSYFVIDTVGKKLLHFPTLYIRVEGHTDNVGDPQMNLELSQARADAVKKYLLKKYPEIKPDHIISKGFGDKKPIASNDTPEGQEENRRVEFIIQN